MKLKRMAAMAAAAAVGPVVLTATPAMAQENPAVTVPDAAPKDDQAAGQQATGFREGPVVSVEGVPGSFEPGGRPTQLTVTVDNKDRASVSGYVPQIGISHDGSLAASHITAEVRDSDGNWKPAALHLDGGPADFRIYLGTSDVKTDDFFSVDVRLAFTHEAPHTAIMIYAQGEGQDAGGQVLSGSSWYMTAVGSGSQTDGEHQGQEDLNIVEGPEVTLTGLPAAGFTAGADWHALSLRIDNTGIGDIEDYDVAMNLGRGLGQGDWLKSSQIRIEAYGLDENDQLGWYPVDVEGSEEIHGAHIGRLSISADEKIDIQLRLRFTEDTPAGPIGLSTFGYALPQSDEDPSVESEVHTYRTKILPAGSDDTSGAGDTGEGGTDAEADAGAGTGSGNDPQPNGGGEQIADTADTAENGSGTAAAPVNAGSQLAATGSDPAVSWAVGSAGIALAMGTAFVAGTGRHRRRTTA